MKTLFLSIFIVFTSLTLSAQCTALFTWDDTDITIQFMDASTTDPSDPIVAWSWDFDDNNSTSSQQNPTYTFSEPDKYDVELTITTQNGCMSSITIEIETCVLAVNHSIGNCDANGSIPVMLTISDIYDNADEIDIILDGSSVPGSPFEIDEDNPVILTVFVPGNGLSHIIQIQSTDIATCGKLIEFIVPDCNSNCFLSSLQLGYPEGVIHTVNVGDDFFSPVSTGMVLGDIVRFNWIGDGHSTTSDATSGPDAWNSGVISVGSTFDVSIQNPGTHPFYCTPHGGTGGAGMSGEILANCPTGNNLDLDVNFNTTLANAQGFNIYYDAVLVPGSPFAYNGIGPQQVTISIAGDGNSHLLMIEDVNDPTCILSANYDSPDCGQGGGNPVCSMSINAGAPGGCDANLTVLVDVTINVANGGAGFDLTVDGGTPTYYTYDGPNTTVGLNLPGDGQNHVITIVDDLDPNCTTMTTILTPNCNLPCSITNLTAIAGGAGGVGIIHSVNVENFIFNPSIVNITVGDQVEWVWTGDVAHTVTSDIPSGPDFFDSGLLDIGATFLSPILSEGAHPYYCEPHGNPGGEGMAGTIFVLPPCNDQGEVMVTVEFDITSNGTSGFEVLVDGSSAGVFPYLGGSAQTATVNVPGDDSSHTIEVRDVDELTCTASTALVTADCNGGGNPICMIAVEAAVSGGCDAMDEVPVELTITASDQGANFTVLIDNIVQGTYAYTGSNTVVTIPVTGDGGNHLITLIDDVDPACMVSTNIITPNCNLPCDITNLTATPAGGGGGGMIHSVNVENYIFNPSIVNITVGDQVEWVWTGDVAHTVTSDIPSGPDFFDSGLLDIGATFLSPILSEGAHPYYCEPHGDPGGVGMAGTIFVLPPCNDQGEVMVTVEFDITSNGTSGFEVLVDGSSAGVFPYVGGSAQTATVNVPGDDSSHAIEVRDVDDLTCTASTTIITPDCNGGGNPICMIAVEAAVIGGCDAMEEVPVELTVTASDQGANFTVLIDNIVQGSYVYTGSNTVVTIPVAGDGQNHVITLVDDVDPACTVSTNIITPNCSLPCDITNLTATPAGGGGGGIIHSVNVENYIFNPSIVNITVGDQIEWVWTGDVAHTVTSDIPSGPAFFDSGLLDIGATFLSPILSEGAHPYYCEPHGDPGGVGMAGTIFVLPPCNDQGEVMVTVEFDITSNGTNGFEIFLDDLSIGIFPYVGGTNQTATIDVLGDDMSHVVEVRDVDDQNCIASTTIVTPDCSGGGNPVCSLDVEATINGGCDDSNLVPIELTVMASDQGSTFHLIVDDNFQGSYAYTGSSTLVNIPLLGDGQSHTITVVDDVDSSCTSSTSIVTPNCESGCSILDIDISFGENKTHIIQVEDFKFIPDSIDILLGDTLLFDWTGTIVHTATSDVQTGPTSFNSGLLSQGATFQFIPTIVGDHPYYCVPHGGPGGNNMAGNISVSQPCDGENAIATISINSEGSSGQGFQLRLDGNIIPESPLDYNPTGNTVGTIAVPGDEMAHVLTIADNADITCIDSISFVSPLCVIDSCLTDILNLEFGDCDGAILPVTIAFSSYNGEEPHNIFLDGILLNVDPIFTDETGNGIYTTSISGIGSDIEIVLTNLLFPSCSDTIIVTSPDCFTPCLISDIVIADGAGIDTCIGEEWLTNFSFAVTAGSPLGYNIFVDGNIWNDNPIMYMDPLGINTGEITIPGDGEIHLITFQDLQTDFCASTISVVSDSCSVVCVIEALAIKTGSEVIHEIEIRDYDFFPSEITVAAGEIVRFIMTGDVLHTTKSDLLTGPDSWDSDLLDTGDTFDIILTTPGEHLYYCAPHGGPNGIGQSGSIQVLPICQEDEKAGLISFTANNGSAEGYKVYIDGEIVGGINDYDNTNGYNELSVLFPADGQQHIVSVQDDQNPICTESANYVFESCDTNCEIAGISYNLISNKHTVLVRDFDYLPEEIVVEAGDTILFDWVGDAPHTVKSDTIDGPSAFNSGLLEKGDQWILILDEIGTHQYYCVPHGGPNNVGMAGSITVVDACDDNEVYARFSFTSSKLSGTYNVEINNTEIIADKSYSGIPQNSFNLLIPADNSSVEIMIIDGQDSSCNNFYVIDGIDCSDPCFGFQSDFNYNIDFATFDVSFTDFTNGNVVSWLWDFGDNNTSTAANPIHTYAEALVFEVCLTVTDDTGCEDTFCDKVRFSDEVCIAGFDYIQNDLDFTFINTSDYEDPETEILWTFGDGEISYEIDSVDHTFELGIYTVCIQISSDSCSSSYCQEIDLSDPCLTVTPDFEISTTGNSLTVDFTDLTVGAADSWLWGFGDGVTSPEQSPTHTYSEFGEYNVCLFVQQSLDECSKSICKTFRLGTTGLLEIEQFSTLDIYPNPSSVDSKVIIEGFATSDFGKSAEISVLSIQGELIQKQIINLANEVGIHLQVTPGIYIVKITSRNNKYRAILIKN